MHQLKTIVIMLILLLSASLFHARAQVVINEYSASNLSTIQDNYQEYEDWIELFNKGNTSVSLKGYGLSDRPGNPMKWVFPDGVTLSPGGYLKIWASGRDEVSGGHIHVNFRLTQTRANADWVVLSDASGNILEQIQLEITQSNHSRGRTLNGGDTWGVFTSPTPGTSNTVSTAYTRYADKPAVSDTGGFYTGPLSITITTGEPNAQIRFTTNGNDPVASSTAYTGPVTITTTKILKARVYSSNPTVLPSLIEFNTYLINVNHDLPVVSIAGNDLLELLNGNSALRPKGSIEFFNKDKIRTTRAYGEFNEHGQDSWVHPQRSIDYITRDEAGYNYALQEKFFALSDRDEFQRVILRAAGDDNYPGIDSSAHMRDDFVQTLSQKAGQKLDVRKSERIVIYANGTYWGIYAIREKVHDHDYTGYYYDQGKYDIQYIMLWGWTWAEYGGQQALDDWYVLHDFIMDNDMSNPFIYQAVTAQYDVESLADYIIINSYVVCSDWLNWNVGWWRGLDPEGSHRKWAYVLWDEDATFGHYINYTGIPAQSPFVSPCFPESLTASWQDPEGHIAVLNKLRDNPDFDQYYISRYIDLLNVAFYNDYMIGMVDSMSQIIATEMPQHVGRWGGNVAKWQSNVQRIRNFITNRNGIIEGGLRECYNLTGPYNIVVDLQPAGTGLVRLNSLDISNFPWSGKYFGGVDVKLTATETNPNYEFDRWVLKHHGVLPNDSALNARLSLSMGDTILALFKPRIFTDSLVINEINYNSADDYNPGDWVEFHNPHPYALDVSNWEFRDEDDAHVFLFPEGTVVAAEGYLVLCQDTALFRPLFPEVENLAGPTGFGFSGGGELLRLFNAEGVLVDTVHYDDTEPWPEEPDGNGPTLELINPAWDNALPESWAASSLHGTPGKVNGNYVGVADDKPVQPKQTISCQILPNPFRSGAMARINSPAGVDDFSFTVYNIYGQPVWQKQDIRSAQFMIPAETFSGGMYIYILNDRYGKRLCSGKMIRE